MKVIKDIREIPAVDIDVYYTNILQARDREEEKLYVEYYWNFENFIENSDQELLDCCEAFESFRKGGLA